MKRMAVQFWFERPARALLAAVALCALPQSGLAANEAPGNAAAVTVLTTAKFCFSDVVDAFGLLIPREEIAVRPDRPVHPVCGVDRGTRGARGPCPLTGTRSRFRACLRTPSATSSSPRRRCD